MNGNKRRLITCTTAGCGRKQSTYSSVRTQCHVCKPKCNERRTKAEFAAHSAMARDARDDVTDSLLARDA